jgi:GT2 family glycosyltransferase
VRLIESDTNEGFARGCNLGMRDLDGVDFVALINNDTVVDPGWLRPLVAAAAPDDIGAVCSKLLFNTHARAVFVAAPVDGTLPDGRQVGAAVRSLTVDGHDRFFEARFDERFWADERSHLHDRGVRWAKQPVASVWWPVDEDAEPSTVAVKVAVAGSDAVTVGDGVEARAVQADELGADVELTIGGSRRIVNSAGGGLYGGWHGGDRGFMEPDVGQFDEPAEVFSWCGGAVLLKTEYLRDVGLFDPTFFLYYEDFDLSWRGRARGWRYLYEPSSVVLHEHAWSSEAGSEFFRFWVDRNRRLTLVKNAPARVAIRAVGGIFTLFAREFGRHVVQQFHRRRPPSPWWLKQRLVNLGRVLGGLPHALRERRRIGSTRTVGHDEIRRWMVFK